MELGDLLQDYLTNDELEAFGVDWDGLRDDTLLLQLCSNYANDGNTSWFGGRGPPPQLHSVNLSLEQVSFLSHQVANMSRNSNTADVIALWMPGCVHYLSPGN